MLLLRRDMQAGVYAAQDARGAPLPPVVPGDREPGAAAGRARRRRAARLRLGAHQQRKTPCLVERGSERLQMLRAQDMPSCEEVVTYRQSYSLWSQRSFLPFLTDDQRAAVLGGNLGKIYPPDRSAQL